MWLFEGLVCGFVPAAFRLFYNEPATGRALHHAVGCPRSRALRASRARCIGGGKNIYHRGRVCSLDSMFGGAPGYAPGLNARQPQPRHSPPPPSTRLWLAKGCRGGTSSSADCREHRTKTAPRVPRVHISYPGRTPDGQWWLRKNHAVDKTPFLSIGRCLREPGFWCG